MADRPILFSAPMVRALLAGTKTQTRRAVKPDGLMVSGSHAPSLNPRIRVGDRLYVREHWRTWAQYDDVAPRDLVAGTHVAYEASDSPNLGNNVGRFRQGMHMPRWASRITLHVTEARVQRLQDISEDDAFAEGVESTDFLAGAERKVEAGAPWTPARLAYADLWNSINGTKQHPDAWSLNPWVAAYTFEVERCNIEQARAA